MMTMCVYAMAKSDAQAVQIANRLRASGFSPSDVSILAPDRGGVRDFGHANATKAPEGAAAGAGGGAILGGALGWLLGMGAIAVPGVGQLVAAGPIIAALSGSAVGGTIGGFTGALVGMGIPEYEAQQYAGELREGNILLCVHADSAAEAARIRDIFTAEKAEHTSTGSEVPVP
jgi:hypothetical protein